MVRICISAAAVPIQPLLHFDVDRTKAAEAGMHARRTSPTACWSRCQGALRPHRRSGWTRRRARRIRWQRRRRSTTSTRCRGSATSPVAVGGPAVTVPGASKGWPTVDARSRIAAVESHYNVDPVIDIFGSVQGRLPPAGVAREMQPIVDAARRGCREDPRPRRARRQVQTMTTVVQRPAGGTRPGDRPQCIC